MSSYPRPWALCGGWAVDAWLGRITRDHGDVDLSVFDADHEQLAGHLAGWQLIAHDSTFSDGSVVVWDGRRLPVPSHIHARAPQDAGPLPTDGICNPEQGWWLDIQIDGIDGDDWVIRSEPRVAIPLEVGVRISPWGVPAVAPEALLFLKASVPRRRDHEDYLRLVRHLDASQRAWLAEAVRGINADHAWLTQLED
jgi:hypothetical protein